MAPAIQNSSLCNKTQDLSHSKDLQSAPISIISQKEEPDGVLKWLLLQFQFYKMISRELDRKKTIPKSLLLKISYSKHFWTLYELW